MYRNYGVSLTTNSNVIALIGNQCKCANEFTREACAKHTDPKACNIPCSKNPDEFCGDSSNVRVYKVWYDEDTAISGGGASGPTELALKLTFKMYPLLLHPTMFNERIFMDAFRECSNYWFGEWYREASSATCDNMPITVDDVSLHDLQSAADAS